ncbi:hypothetical protein [Formosa sp. A9]|uniref:hypothetical protein n=1 Tax=Formosa sp. A9 TaxID=3442641 RepID=UPI003EBE9079
MKNIGLILLFLVNFSINAQEKLIGNYCTIPIGESDVTCYSFKENQQFEFKISGCLGISTYGKGNYSIKNKQLLLNFDNGKGSQNSRIVFKKLKETSQDSITLKLKVSDVYGIGIPAKIYPKEMDLMDFDFEKNYADINGNWIWKNKKNSESKHFVISENGYAELEFAIDLEKSQEIEIVLAPPSPNSISSKEFRKNIEIIDSDNLRINGMKFKREK